MIRVIHGGNSLASFQALEKILSQYSDLSTTRLNGSDTDLKTIREALETPSFEGQRLVVLEDLSRNRSQSLVTELKKYLANLPESEDLVIYERRLLPPESPILALSRSIQAFPQPAGLNVFDWADQVGKRQLHASLEGWEKLVKAGDEPEYLFLMLVRQFRLLLLLKKGERAKIPEFVENKLRSQLRFWTERDLLAVYRKLWELDRLNKTGVMPLEVSIISLLSSIGRVEKEVKTA